MSDGTQSENAGPLPQQTMTMLFSVEEFDEKVVADVENLCCVVVTSTLCAHSGVRKLKYPAPSRPQGDGDEDDDVDASRDDEDDHDTDAAHATPSFFQQVKRRLVMSERHLAQRRHVRFFHVCACLEHETNIQPRMAKDIAFAVARRKPNAVELAELHKAAYADLVQLLHHLRVSSTPTMLFFVRGKPLSYADVHPTLGAHADDAAGVYERHLSATGANVVKWRTVFRNAVALRNALLKEHDAEVRAQALQAKRDALRSARLERKRRQAAEEQEEGEDDDYDAY